MDSLQPILFGLLVLVACLLVVGWPLVMSRQAQGRVRAEDGLIASLKGRADLLDERRQIYAAIRDLEMEYRVDKVNEADFGQAREALVVRAVDVLKRLDTFTAPDPDPVEALIAAYKQGQPKTSASARFCPNCGTRAHLDDLFCGNCGQALS